MVLWILRLIGAILWFVVVWLGVPYLLAFVSVPPPPDNLMKALAGLVALLWLVGDYQYRWLGRGTPVA